MPKANSASFVFELPLIVQPAADRTLAARMETGKRLFNVVLQEALRRLDLMRQSKAWQAARRLPKGAARNAAFRACQKSIDLNEYALHAVVTQHKNAGGFSDRMSSNEAQKIATRVWQAVEKHMIGLRGRPRFKGRARPLHSVEGKTNKQGIRWQPETGCLVWGDLFLPARLPTAAQDPYAAEALQARTKYCRLVWRTIKGQRRWFVQLIQEGEAPRKYEFLANGEDVGLDIGPSTIAIASNEAVALARFAPGVAMPAAEKRRLQRALARSRRATNPNNYDANGRAKRGCKWHRSRRYEKIRAQAAEIERVLAATRKKEHGELANQILGLGNVIKTEKLSYVAFQKCFGRSTRDRAPGAFVSLLKRKADSAGGELIELPTWTLRMSQYDHVSATYAKKPLSLRWHALDGGPVLVQRDCYSAWLAQHVQAGEHNPRWLGMSWPAAEPLLRRAGLCLGQSASGKLPCVPTVAIPLERIARRKVFARGLSRNAVAETRESDSPAWVST